MKETIRVSYKLFAEKKLLHDCVNSPCYSYITYGALGKEVTDIVLYHHKESTPYNEKEWEEWVNYMCGWGFPAKFLGSGSKKFSISSNFFVIQLPIKTKTKVFYEVKEHLSSALQIARYLMESKINEFPKTFFELRMKLPDLDTFKLMQYAHRYIQGNTNHTIKDTQLTGLLSREEFENSLKKSKHSIYKNPYPSISNFWEQKGKVFKITGSDREVFEACNNKIFSIYVVGGDTTYTNWLPKHVFVNDVESADLVVFTGGEDVSPELYNEKKHPLTYCNPERDKKEKEIFNEALRLKKKMLGICRGSQFLCVMSGGRLVQHQYNIPEHPIKTTKYGELTISSTHHQAAYPYNIPSYKYTIIGWTEGVSIIHEDGDRKEMKPGKECEIVYYRYTNALGIQGHPEFLSYQKKHPKSILKLKNIFNNFLNDSI